MNGTANIDSSGMLISDPSGPAPSNVDMRDPDGTRVSGFLDSLENFGSQAVHAAGQGVEAVYGGLKTVAGDVVTGTENLTDHVTGTLTGPIVVILLIVGVSLVLIAKTGAVKVGL